MAGFSKFARASTDYCHGQYCICLKIRYRPANNDLVSATCERLPAAVIWVVIATVIGFDPAMLAAAVRLPDGHRVVNSSIRRGTAGDGAFFRTIRI